MVQKKVSDMQRWVQEAALHTVPHSLKRMPFGDTELFTVPLHHHSLHSGKYVIRPDYLSRSQVCSTWQMNLFQVPSPALCMWKL